MPKSWPSIDSGSRRSERPSLPSSPPVGRTRHPWGAAWGLLCTLVLACQPPSEPPAPGPTVQTPSTPSPSPEYLRLSDDPWHFPGDCFELTTPTPTLLPVALEAGEVLDLAVDEGVDMAVSIRRQGEDETLLRADLPVDKPTTERLIFLAPESALFEIVITPLGASSAEISGEPVEPTRVRIRSLGPPTDRDLQLARGARLVFEAEQESNSANRAERLLDAAKAWRRGGEPRRRALALHQAGHADALSPTGLPRARQSLTTALELFETQDNRRHQALTLYWLGKVAGRQGDLPMAIHWSRRGLRLMEEVGQPHERATLANDLAGYYLRRGRVHNATELYFEALEHWKQISDSNGEATTRTNLGVCYMSRGALLRALEQYRRAVALLDESERPKQLAFALTRLGDVLLELEGPATARPILEKALALRRAQDDRRGEAITLNSLGKVALAAHHPVEALETLRRSHTLLHQLEDRWSEAVVRNGLGRAYEGLGQTELAEREFDAARTGARAAGHPHAEAEALYGLARLTRGRGELATARQRIEEAIERIEQIRDSTPRQDLRSAFLATKQDYYDFLVDLLAELHRAEPRAGHAAAAFVVAERARARSLLDTFTQVSDRLEEGIDPELLGRLDGLRKTLDEARRTSAPVSGQDPEVSGGPRGNPPGGGGRGTITHALERLRQTEATLAARHHRYTAWTQPTLYDPDRASEELLDADTLVLSYHLGERRSFLWILEQGTMDFRDDLPPRAVFEAAALDVFERMRESHFETSAVAARLAAEHFSDLALGPVADRLGDRRLVISAPGVLEYVPFAALPDPRTPADGDSAPALLVEHHEIVRLPSLSVLAALRRERADREPPAGDLAILADPVFGPDDSRLGPHMPAASPTLETLPRLVHSRREAETMMALAPGPTFLATGFAANRQMVLDGELSGYRILHFATHGTFDTEMPELSSLVLSRFDAEGRPVDGELRAYEIFTLRLPADLVVLSACRTALGREIRGEGLVGLARGFMEAGASRVLVSLWDVDDKATAELMRHFYRALFAGEIPSQALRLAQLELAKNSEWSAPHYWAAFVLLGDWL